MMGVVALVVIVALALLDPGTAAVMERLHWQAVTRETQRVLQAITDLRSNIGISSKQIVFAVVVLLAALAAVGYMGSAVWRSVRFAMKHDRSRRKAREFSHVTDLSDSANKVSKAQFAGWLDLLARVSVG